MQLTFSKYDFTIKADAEQQVIFDIVRKKYVALTPEEWVRQHILHYLIFDYKYPKACISVEKLVIVNTLRKRTDIVLYNTSAQPKLIIECKAPEVKIAQKTFEQIARYNMSLRVPYLWVTNGSMHFLSAINFQEHSFKFIDALPPVSDLTA